MRWIDIVFIIVISILIIAVAYLYTGNQKYIKENIESGKWRVPVVKSPSNSVSNAP